MFSITKEYIEQEYIIAGNYLMLTSEHTAREIEQKARKVMGILKRGIKFTPTQADVMAIFEKLRKNRLKNLFNIIITWCQHHVDKGGQGENGGSD